jgi:hypothetical protein
VFREAVLVPVGYFGSRPVHNLLLFTVLRWAPRNATQEIHLSVDNNYREFYCQPGRRIGARYDDEQDGDKIQKRLDRGRPNQQFQMRDYFCSNETRPMKKFAWTVAITFLLLGGPASAQFYRYIDQNGNLRFTDDINKVPIEQRANIREYRESGKRPTQPSSKSMTSPEKSPTEIAKPDSSQQNNALSTGAHGTGSDEELRARIEKMIEQVEAEYQALTKEKDALANRRALIKNWEELDAFNQSVDAFNQHAENYEKMSNRLKNLIDEYNALISEKTQN